MLMIRRTLFLLLLAVVVVLLPTWRVNAEGGPSKWAVDDVNFAISMYLVPKPLQANYTGQITRSQFCAIAVTIYENLTNAKINDLVQFDDTLDINVQKMAGLGVVNGIGGNLFAPDRAISREQAAVILTNIMAKFGEAAQNKAPSYLDNADISDWALTPVAHMHATGIMQGVGYNTFLPNGYFSVEHSIVALLRLFKYLADGLREKNTDIVKNGKIIFDRESFILKVVDLSNQERVKSNVGLLKYDKELCVAADRRARDLELLFSHDRPVEGHFYSALDELGIKYYTCGENIALGQTSPESVMEGWIKSEEHRENLINRNFNKTGIGIYVNSFNRLCWVQLFSD